VAVLGRNFGTLDFGGGPITSAGASDVVLAHFTLHRPTGADRLPALVYLSEVHPNPFAGTAHATYGLQESGPVTLRIYDVQGRLVKVLREGREVAGPHGVVWDGRDDAGRTVASGVYFYRLQTNNATLVHKAVSLR
jgi:hypothetical protein